jgi:hypothetical protein
MTAFSTPRRFRFCRELPLAQLARIAADGSLGPWERTTGWSLRFTSTDQPATGMTGLTIGRWLYRFGGVATRLDDGGRQSESLGWSRSGVGGPLATALEPSTASETGGTTISIQGVRQLHGRQSDTGLRHSPERRDPFASDAYPFSSVTETASRTEACPSRSPSPCRAHRSNSRRR